MKTKYQVAPSGQIIYGALNKISEVLNIYATVTYCVTRGGGVRNMMPFEQMCVYGGLNHCCIFRSLIQEGAQHIDLIKFYCERVFGCLMKCPR